MSQPTEVRAYADGRVVVIVKGKFRPRPQPPERPDEPPKGGKKP
jgi:hypothetical protein